MTKRFAVTAKKTRNPITFEHYLDYLDYLTDLGKVANVHFETTRGLHTHFVLEVKDKLDFNLLKPTKYGWNVKAVPVYDPKGWTRYCRKDYKKNTVHNKLVQKYDDSESLLSDTDDGFVMPTKRIIPKL